MGKEKDEFAMDLKVPFNTVAEVRMSSQEKETLVINDLPWAKFIAAQGMSNTNVSTLSLGSGSYDIRYKVLD